MGDFGRGLMLGVSFGFAATSISLSAVRNEGREEHEAMRTVTVSVRRNIDTAILLAPAVAPSDVALACCVGE